MRFRTASVRDQDLKRGDAAAAVGGRNEVLGDDALERPGELHPDLPLLGGRETRRLTTVDRLRCTLRMQRCEHEVDRSRRRSNAVEIVSRSRIFADEDDVGIFNGRAARSASANVVASGRARAGFTMHEAVPVQELDRVFDRKDVLVPRLVDVCEQ